MIGQKELIVTLDKLIADNNLPHFIIITGTKGSGKKLLASHVAENISDCVATVDINVDAIRDMIETSYKVVKKSVYIIPDADTMSLPAKNALLKVTEEPPNNAYFIMTLEDAYNTLQTIRSRGTIFTMQNYTQEELLEFINSKFENVSGSGDWRQSVLKIAQTPGEIKELTKFDIDEFYKFVELVVDNIADSVLANTFKISDKLALAKDAEGYDLKLFFKAFTTICLQRMTGEDAPKYAKGVSITSGALRDININGISKQMLVDDWILEMRKAWS